MPEAENRGVRIHYEDVGTGPAVVLLHSFLCSGEMWEPQVPVLAERHRVLNVDLRGHGRSDPAEAGITLYDLLDDVVTVLDAAGVERAVWCGLSIGGMIALRAALTRAERVSALVVLDSHAGAESALRRLRYGAMGLGSRLLGIRPFLGPVSKLMFGPTTRRSDPALVASWVERFSAVHLPSILAGLGALVERDSVVGRLGEIAVPALVVVGDEDPSLPPALSREIAAGIPGARLVEVPRAGHLSNLERPDVVTGAIVDFLGGLPAGDFPTARG